MLSKTLSWSVIIPLWTNEPSPQKATRIEVLQQIDVMKDRARNTQDSTRQVIQFATQNLSQAAKGHMPCDKNLSQVTQRLRNKTEQAPPNPDSLVNLQIPQSYKEYEYDKVAGQVEQFLYFDSGPGNDRILLFTTRHNLELLEQAQYWYALAFVPIPDLPRYVTDLANHLGGRSPLLPVLQYLEDSYIGRAPRFPGGLRHLQFSLPKPGLSMIEL